MLSLEGGQGARIEPDRLVRVPESWVEGRGEEGAAFGVVRLLWVKGAEATSALAPVVSLGW